MIILFYLLIAVLPLEEHWFWRQELFGSFTVIKALGTLCLLIALGRLCIFRQSLNALGGWIPRWFFGFVALQFGSYFLHGSELGVDPSVYWHVFAIVVLLITTVAFADTPERLPRVMLMAICGVGFASLYTIRGQQLGGGDGRASGVFADANYYALVVGLWLPLAYLWAVGRRPLFERVLCFGCFASMLLGSLFAASRGGALGLVAALLFLIWHSKQRIRNFVILAVIVIPLLFASGNLVRRFLEPGYGDQRAEDARLVVWKAALRMIRVHPFTGVGLGNFKPLVEGFEDADAGVVSVTHNTYLETAAELGIPAVVIHIGVFIGAFVALGRIRRESRLRYGNLNQIALGLQAGLVSYAISAFFVSTWWENMPWLTVFLTISMDALSKRMIERANKSARSRLSENELIPA